MSDKYDQREAFLLMVLAYVKTDPEVVGQMFDVLSRAIRERLDESMERASDMETLLVISSSRKFAKAFGGNPAIKERLLKWKDKTSLRWDTLYETVTGEKLEKD